MHIHTTLCKKQKAMVTVSIKRTNKPMNDKGREDTLKKRLASHLYIDVGGHLFLLDLETIVKLDSELLNSRIYDCASLLSSSADKKDRLQAFIRIDADHECFATFVQLARYDSLPISALSKNKQKKLLEQAELWGIHSNVSMALFKAREDIILQAALLQGSPQTTQRFFCRPHHNHRMCDTTVIAFGSYCTQCSFSEQGEVFLEGERYSHCLQCQRDIFYKSDLDFCHNCRCCSDCQQEDALPGRAFEISTCQDKPGVLALVSKLEEKTKRLQDAI